MCLKINLFKSKKITIKDITVCKVVIFPLNTYRSGITAPITPYRQSVVEFGKLNTSKLERTIWNVHMGLHSYSNLEDAIDSIIGLIDTTYWYNMLKGDIDIHVYESIIPKGSEYYFGKHHTESGSYDSYASDKLIITDQLLYSFYMN